MNILYKAQNDDTNVTTRPFFFIWMNFVVHYKIGSLQENIHKYSKLIKYVLLHNYFYTIKN